MKAVLILNEMPERCVNRCPCEYDFIYCKAANKNLDYPTADEHRPDWCPLSALPEQKDTHTCSDMDNLYNAGWNACLDAIEEEV